MRLRPFADLGALGLLLGLLLLFFWPLLTPDLTQRSSIAPVDFANQLHPYHAYTASQLKQGRLPLWNPAMFGGHPFQADLQTAIFAPMTLLTVLLAGSREGLSYFALELRAIADYGLAALFTYLLLRHLTGQRGAALVGATAYTFSGYLTSYPMDFLPILETAALAPLLLYLLERAATAPRWSPWAVGAGLTYGLAVLAGHAQTSLFLGYAALGYAVWRSWAGGLRRVAGVAMVFAAFGFGLAAVQVLPTAEFLPQSIRSRMDYETASSGFDLLALPGMLLPGWRKETPLYVGVVTWLLAGVGMVRGWRSVGPWVVLAIMAVLLSLGGGTFLHRALFEAVPGFALFRHQERSIGLFPLAMAVLASYGVAALGRTLPELRTAVAAAQRYLPGLALLLGLGLLLILFGWQNHLREEFNPFTVLFQSYMFFLIILGLGLALLFAWSRGLSRPALTAGLLAVMVLDLFTVSAGKHFVPGTYSVPEQLKQTRALLAGQTDPFRVDVHGDTGLPGAYGALVGWPGTSGDTPLREQRLHTLYNSVGEERLWALLGITHLLTSSQQTGPRLERLAELERLGELQRLVEEDGQVLYRLRNPAPRLYAAQRIQVIAEEKRSLEAVASPSFDPRTMAILEVEPPPELAGSRGAPAEVRLLREDPQRLEIQVEGAAPSLVIINDPYYPGWRASLDGQPLPILRANYAFRAVAVPAGRHLVVMEYRPLSFALGAGISLATLAAAGAVLALRGRLP